MASSRPESPTSSLTRKFSSLDIATEQVATMSHVGSNATPESTTASNPDTGKTEDKIKIDFFYGDRPRLRAYLIQLKLAFQLNPTRFTTECKKVLFATTYLRGAAFSWFEPYVNEYLEDEMEDETEKLFQSFDAFEGRLKQVFGTVDEERSAARQIHQLRQIGSAALYYSNFQQIASRLDWDDEAKASAYYMGLSDAVKDHMIPEPPKNFQKLIDLSIKIDNRLHERRMEKKGHYTRPVQGYGQTRRNRDYGDPMDLDMMQPRGPSRSGKQPFRGKPLGNQERERRRKDNLCYTTVTSSR